MSRFYYRILIGLFKRSVCFSWKLQLHMFYVAQPVASVMQHVGDTDDRYWVNYVRDWSRSSDSRSAVALSSLRRPYSRPPIRGRGWQREICASSSATTAAVAVDCGRLSHRESVGGAMRRCTAIIGSAGWPQRRRAIAEAWGASRFARRSIDAVAAMPLLQLLQP